MSAPAIKSSMPGVGTSPPTSGHSMLPMNMMAQKVVPGTESGAMKPMSGSGLSYVTLQPASQPLSLVQDHRPSVYQTPSYTSNNSEKESETEKLVQNGMEPTKVESEQEVSVSAKESESNRNNNLSPENLIQERQIETESESELAAISLDFPALCAHTQNKAEEKKTPVNNGSKESDGISVNTVNAVALQTKPLVFPAEEPKVEIVQKSKPVMPSSKFVVESSVTPLLTNPLKSELKVTNSPRNIKRKSRELKDLKGTTGDAEGGSKPKRNRIQTQPYQSPLPEIALIVKTLNKPPALKNSDDKLIVFYKNEFLAVRNAEGSFYVCQAMQNIYKSSRRIRIRWLSQDKNNGEIYSPDFYDFTDFDCILTNLNLNKIDKNKFQLTKIELLRTENILKRAIDVEAGVSEKPRVTEEHPDGLDLSLYKDESQLKRRKGSGSGKQKQRQRKRSKRSSSTSDDEVTEEESDKKISTKSNRIKKRPVNKALAIAKSVAKGPSRAERALNRGTKSNTGIISGNTATTSLDSSKKSTTEIKKVEAKKVNKQQSNNASRLPRTKLRGSVQCTQESSIAGRPKRVAATTSIASAEDPSSRKKSRGRA